MPSPTPASPVLRVSDLTVYRGRTVILDRISWTVEPGQHWVILGPNGSGKTSLLAAMTAYLTPSGGTIEVLGEEFGDSDWPALRRRIGLVSPALRHLLHDDEPAIEIVIGGRYAAIDIRDKPKPRDVRLARRLLDGVGCLALAQRPWAVLSQGERQRILIARALMARPDVLILDEPCAGLDPVAREHFLALVAHLGQNARPALLLVTHHVEEIVPVFQHALVLREGRILAAGPTREVLNGATLSRAFGTPLRLRRSRGRYALSMPRGSGRKTWTAGVQPVADAG
ncbi:MAG: ABC transporter ATP-binding protein [Limisphaerales bacterium]